MAYFLTVVLPALFLIPLFGILFWLVYKLAPSFREQKTALVKMDESLALARRMIELHEETNALLRQQRS